MKIIKKLGLLILTAFSLSVAAETYPIKEASDWGRGDLDFPATNVIDGNMSWDSRWVAEGSPVHLVLDLGEVRKITDVGIAWGRGNQRVYTFEIWARADSSQPWVKVLGKGDSSGKSSNIENYDIDDIEARFVRVKTHTNSAGTDMTDIIEVRIHNGQPSSIKPINFAKPAQQKQVSNTAVRYQELQIDRIYDDAADNSKYPSSNAIDGDLSYDSRWAGSNDGSAVNLIAQFEQATEIKEIGVVWGKADKRTYTFEIYARPATNGKWIRLYKAVSKLGDTGVQLYDIEDMLAKQVRIKVRFNSDESEWMEINELKIFGGDKAKGKSASVAVSKPKAKPVKLPDANWNWSLWDIRGTKPASSSKMAFTPLKTKYTTKSGHGWRHELKIKKNQRKAMEMLDESFNANVYVNLSKGAKTIIAQYQTEDKGGIMKVFIGDVKGKGLLDGKANNGYFDVYVQMQEEGLEGTKQITKALGTVRSGDNFNLQINNVYSYLTVKAFGESLSVLVEDTSESSFSFGNYLQAQGAESGVYIKYIKNYAKFYKDAGIKVSEITFDKLSYSRSGL